MSMTQKNVTQQGIETAQRVRRVRSTWIRQVLLLLSVIGPGLITANVDNDATGITGYSLAGAQYGYGLLWAVVLVTISLAVVQEMAARMGVVPRDSRQLQIRRERPADLVPYLCKLHC
jgi:Mn2+/Fe2+ NRAMP family transporter